MIKHLSIITALALAVPAQAQEATIDPDHIMGVLKDAGYPAEYFNEDMDYRQILSKSGNDQFLVELYECEDGKTCDVIEFFSNFPSDVTPTKAKLDAYPGPRDGARLSLDRRGEARVQQEIQIGDSGLDDAVFLDQLKSWETVLANVAAYLYDRPLPGARGAADAAAAVEAAADAAAESAPSAVADAS